MKFLKYPPTTKQIADIVKESLAEGTNQHAVYRNRFTDEKGKNKPNILFVHQEGTKHCRLNIRYQPHSGNSGVSRTRFEIGVGWQVNGSYQCGALSLANRSHNSYVNGHDGIKKLWVYSKSKKWIGIPIEDLTESGATGPYTRNQVGTWKGSESHLRSLNLPTDITTIVLEPIPFEECNEKVKSQFERYINTKEERLQKEYDEQNECVTFNANENLIIHIKERIEKVLIDEIQEDKLLIIKCLESHKDKLSPTEQQRVDVIIKSINEIYKFTSLKTD